MNWGVTTGSFGSEAFFFERADGNYEYLHQCAGQSLSDSAAHANEAGRAGFRLLPLANPIGVMERQPGVKTMYEYLLVGPGNLSVLLDEVTASRGEGFRVVRLGVDWVLLEHEMEQSNAPEPDQ